MSIPQCSSPVPPQLQSGTLDSTIVLSELVNLHHIASPGFQPFVRQATDTLEEHHHRYLPHHPSPLVVGQAYPRGHGTPPPRDDHPALFRHLEKVPQDLRGSTPQFHSNLHHLERVSPLPVDRRRHSSGPGRLTAGRGSPLSQASSRPSSTTGGHDEANVMVIYTGGTIGMRIRTEPGQQYAG